MEYLDISISLTDDLPTNLTLRMTRIRSEADHALSQICSNNLITFELQVINQLMLGPNLGAVKIDARN